MMQKSEVETDILDVSEYLSLKLLGRDAKVKLSDVFDATKWTGNSSLLAVSNKLGWFVAGTPTGLVASPLTHLRETQASSNGDGPTPIEPKHRISLSGAPYFVHFATSHTKVVVVVRADNTWNLEIFNSEDICRESVGDVKPTHTLSLGAEDVVDMQPNPSEESEVIAILRGRNSSSVLDMINVTAGSRINSWGAANSADESTALTSISWSVRGKQIVAGTRGGDLVQFTPEGERKQTIPPPPSLSSPQSVVSVLWLENTVFHVVYGNPTSDPSDPTHEYEVYNILFDSKANSANYVKFIDPSPPYGVASRLSCRHYARLVGWEPAKHLIFVADGPSTDVGAIACLNQSEIEGKPSPWVTLEVDETSRIALPMDDEMNETSIMGFDLDLTATEPISNSQEAGDDAVPSPPSPILHLYTSAGLVISYHVLNSRGDKYPGMGTAEVPSAVSATPAKALASTTPAVTPAFGASTTPAGTPAFGTTGFGTSTTPAKPGLFGQPSTTPAFGQTSAPAFGQGSGFGTTSAFGATSAFGSKPAFGSSSFGAASGGGFGKFSSTTPAGTPASGGFAGFGSKPATFGSTLAPTTSVFGSGSGSTTPKTESPLSAFGSSAFGGGTGATTPKSAFGGFGSSTPSVSSPVKPRDGSANPESPPPAAKSPIDMSPPGSPAAQSDSGIEVGDLSIGDLGKKPPAGLDESDDESEHDPTETPSKPPTSSTSGFSGFGKSSAFGTATTGGAFAIKPATAGAFGSSTGATLSAPKPASGFGAFGTKSASPSTGFTFGSEAKNTEKSTFSFSGGPAFGSSAFGSGASGGSTPAFGSTTFGSSTSGTSKPAFGSTAFGSTAFGSTAFGSGASESSTAPADSAPKSPPADEQQEALFKSAMSFLDGVFGTASKPTSAFGDAPTFGATSAPAFGATSAFGAAAKPADPSAPKAGGGFSAFAAPKPGESKITGGFAGFGDAAKNKGGFLGFGDNAKKNIFAEPAEPEEKKEETKQESAPKKVKDSEEPKPETKPEAKPETKPETPKSAPDSLPASSTPPKPNAQSIEAAKPANEAPSKIPVPKPSLLDRLSPRPEPQVQAEPEPPKSESSTPPGSPSPSASPPPAPPKSAPPPTPSPFGLSKPALKPFGSAPLRSSPLASPPVTRENEPKLSNEAPIKAPALTSKASSENVAKPATTGFFGFGKPPATEKKETKPATTEKPSGSFLGAAKGGAAPVSAGSPAAGSTSTPSIIAAPSAKPPSLFSGSTVLPSPFSAPKPPASTSPAPTAAAPPATKSSFFTAPAASSPIAPASLPFSGFGTKPGPSPSSVASSSPAPSSIFGQPPAAKTPPATSTPPASAPSFGFANFKPLSSTSATPPPQAEPSPLNTSGLSNVEIEFNKLLEHMSLELGKAKTNMLQQRQAQISRANVSAPITIQKTEDPSKWGLGDLVALKQVTGLVAKEIDGLKGLNKDFVAQMTELQPGAEKVQAKRNEIARHIKAKKDPRYTRLIKSRTSSPEHIENQTKLRKSLQMVRERTRQLEDFMATQRSRIQKQKEGRREFKVPSIDTINRTMRNIDSALAQKSEEIVALTARVDRMKLKAPRRKGSTTAAPLTIPPAENEKIKLASASALNMERSSLRLKNALLQARTETPLNTTAVGAPVEEKPNTLAKMMAPKPAVPATPAALPTVPPVTSTPAPSFPLFGQPPVTPNPFAPSAPTMPAKAAAPIGGFNFAPVTPSALPAFTPLGKDEFHVTAGYEHSARRSEKSRMHGSSAKLKTPSPNISRTDSDAVGASPLPAPALAPTIAPAKSFFGSGPTTTTTPSTGKKAAPVPEGFFSFSNTPGGPVASTPPPKGFNFFQTPAQKAASTTSTTPAIPPIPSWGTPNSSISSVVSTPSVRSRVKNDQGEDDDEGSEGHSGEEGEEDEEDDDDWVPDDDDDDEDDDEDVSDGVPEGEEDDEDQTARI
ncbi:Nuclear pore complex [Rhizoctonia solani]|uniref:Nuclear pore complex n=1 Tax=Rhizoctonia solani TaxID=456999 RepID=A0A8H7LKC1_9AGAM|nr:Nuclear pore complex [Rhizoctonia solani]